MWLPVERLPVVTVAFPPELFSALPISVTVEGMPVQSETLAWHLQDCANVTVNVADAAVTGAVVYQTSTHSLTWERFALAQVAPVCVIELIFPFEAGAVRACTPAQRKRTSPSAGAASSVIVNDVTDDAVPRFCWERATVTG